MCYRTLVDVGVLPDGGEITRTTVRELLESLKPNEEYKNVIKSLQREVAIQQLVDEERARSVIASLSNKECFIYLRNRAASSSQLSEDQLLQRNAVLDFSLSIAKKLLLELDYDYSEIAR